MLTAAARRRLAVALFIFVWFAYLATASGRIKTSDIQTEFRVATSLVLHGNLQADKTHDTRVGLDGHNYSDHGIGASLLLVPAVLVDGGVETSRAVFVIAMVNPLLSAGTAVLLLLLLLDLGFSPRAGLVITLLYAFATIAWPYAHDSFDVTAAAFLGLLALWAARRRGEGGGWRWVLLSGVALAVGVLIRYSTGLAVLPIAAYLAWRRRRQGPGAILAEVASWLGPIAGVTLLVAWLNWARWGDPLQLGLPEAAQNYVQPLAEQAISLVGLLASPGKGLLLFSPLFILGAVGVRRLLHRDAAFTWVTVAVVAVTLLFYARLTTWHGDYSWGPRMLVPLAPLLMLWCAPMLALWPSLGRASRAAVAALVAAGVAVQSVDILTGWERVMTVILQRTHPPFETTSDPLYYFDLANSQLLLQFRSVGTMLFGPNPFGQYAVSDGSQDLVYLYTPDFWWADPWTTPALRPFLVVVAVLLLLLVVLSGLRLLKAARGLPKPAHAGTAPAPPVIKSEQVSQIL
ncbi:MAG: glycosyltransferase family 39 protein [Candidatus Dormiibacterota bacterium]